MWCVEKIGSVSAKLQTQAFGNVDRAEQAKVEVHGAWSQQRIATYVSITNSSHGRKCGGVIERMAGTDSAKFFDRRLDLVRRLPLADGVQRSAGGRNICRIPPARMAGDGAE